MIAAAAFFLKWDKREFTTLDVTAHAVYSSKLGERKHIRRDEARRHRVKR